MPLSKILIMVPLYIVLFFSYALCFPSVGRAPQKTEDRFMPEGENVKVEAWISNLEIPWSLIFLPGVRALVSERPGRIRLIENNGLQAEPYFDLNVAAIGEGGLMGLAAHPDFPRKPFIYAMHTYKENGSFYNRVVRIKDHGSSGTFDRVIIDKIPGGRFHNGGRIAFGPDRMLYITAGETFDADLAQDLNSLGGKILRVTPEGRIPDDNPFKGSPVYSYGHRNPQGLAWDSNGTLFSSEHGPSGEYILFANDEINIINKGDNYGWPETVGAAGKRSYIDPLIVWKKTTPPSGVTFYKGDKLKHLKGDLFVTSLKGKSLIRITLRRDRGRYEAAKIERWFADDYDSGKYGRLRDVVEGPDGFLYFLTNNKDGRGTPNPGDDKIYRIMPR